MKSRLQCAALILSVIGCSLLLCNAVSVRADISIIDSTSPEGCIPDGTTIYYQPKSDSSTSVPEICWQQALPETPGLWVLWSQAGGVDYSSGTQPPLEYLDSWAAACEQEAPASAFALSLSWLTTDPWMQQLSTDYTLLGYCVFSQYPPSYETGPGCRINAPAHSTANLKSGNLYFSQDVGGLVLSFNSLDPVSAVLGYGWTHNFNKSISILGNGVLRLQEGNGNNLYFSLINGVYWPDPASGDHSSINKKDDGSYTRTMKNGIIQDFDASGRLLAITDRNGNATTLSYNGSQLAGITDFNGRQTTITTGANGKIATITVPGGSTYSLTYSNGYLIAITDPAEKSWQFRYDANGNMIAKIDPAGNEVTYMYEANGKYLSSADPEGKARSLSYSASTDTATFTEKDGGVWIYQYDPTLHVTTAKTDPLGGVTHYVYDANRNLVSETDPAGNTTTFTYDAAGNMTSATNALGQVNTFTYNDHGQVTSSTDPDGNVTTYLYDGNGDLLSVTDPTGGAVSYTYDARGNRTSATDAKNNVTRFVYNQSNDLITITDPLGAVTTLSYDAAGNLVRTEDPQGGVTEYFYDTRRQLMRTRDPLGNITAYSYDPNGNPASMTDGNGNTTTYAYNYHGQVTQSTDALGGVTALLYGGTGCPSCGGGADKLTALTDAKQQTTTFEYDTLGRLITETDPLGRATSSAYDSRGNLIAKTDALGQTIVYRYDELNRLREKSYPDGGSDLFEYDARGNLTRTENSVISYTFTYDALNRLIEVTDSDNRTVQYTYDANSNRLSLTDPLGRTTRYSYTRLNRLTGLETPAGSFSFSYDSLGRRTALTFPNGLSSAATFDAASNLSSLAFKDAAATLTSTSYAYDRIGNQVAAISSPSRDNLPIPPSGHSTYDAGNRLLDDGTYQYDYDNKGNLVSKIKATTMEVTTYSWDAEGRLIRVHLPDGTTARYAYDPFGRRIEKSVNGTVSRYLYDAASGAILLEYDGAGVVVRSYTHALGVGDPLMLESGGNAYFYLNDHLGTPQQLVDQSGTVVWSAVYDAYGEAHQDVALVENNLRFPGQYFDEETGLHYNWHRYYDPQTGRYLTPDPIGLKGGMNLFLYAGANPINAIDPKGLQKIYGNWCGPDWTGGYDKPWDQLTEDEKQSVTSAVDELDSCCETHDKCYAKCRENFPCLEDDRKMCFRQCDLELHMCPGTMDVRGPRSYLIKKYMQDTNPGAGDNSPMCSEK